MSRAPERFRVAIALLNRLKAYRIASVREFHFRERCRPILEAGKRHLFVVLEGNAFVFQRLHIDEQLMNRFRTGKFGAGDLPLHRINHYLLCRGDLIGELEFASNRDAMYPVLAGLPFRTGGNSKNRECNTVCVEIPVPEGREATLRDLATLGWQRKTFAGIAIQEALRQSKLHERLDIYLGLCFAGALPVLKAFVSSESGHVLPSTWTSPMDRHLEGGEIRGIELSTKYLELLGFDAARLDTALGDYLLTASIYWRKSDKRAHPSFERDVDAPPRENMPPEAIQFFLPRGKDRLAFTRHFNVPMDFDMF